MTAKEFIKRHYGEHPRLVKGAVVKDESAIKRFIRLRYRPAPPRVLEVTKKV